MSLVTVQRSPTPSENGNFDQTVTNFFFLKKIYLLYLLILGSSWKGILIWANSACFNERVMDFNFSGVKSRRKFLT